jgi:4-hydroxyphenylpyruvate dioxygenase-like putative hemolysin
MEPDNLWGFAFVEMALDGIPHVAAEVFQRIGFSKDGMTERTGRETAFRGLFDDEY